MSSEEIKKTRARIAAKLNQLENTDDVNDILELTLKELSAISGGLQIQCCCRNCYGQYCCPEI